MDKIITTTENFTIYIGSKVRYKGPFFTRGALYDNIHKYSEENGVMCVSISATTYLAGDYIEDGWAIHLINYGRFEKSFKERHDWMKGLALHLLKALNQNRITLVGPHTTELYQNEDPEETHKCSE